MALRDPGPTAVRVGKEQRAPWPALEVSLPQGVELPSGMRRGTWREGSIIYQADASSEYDIIKSKPVIPSVPSCRGGLPHLSTAPEACAWVDTPLPAGTKEGQPCREVSVICLHYLRPGQSRSAQAVGLRSLPSARCRRSSSSCSWWPGHEANRIAVRAGSSALRRPRRRRPLGVPRLCHAD